LIYTGFNDLGFLSLKNPKVKSRVRIKFTRERINRSSSDSVDFALLKDGKLIELHKEEEATFK
jgi:ribonuclease G